MTSEQLKAACELAREWEFYATRFGIVDEVSNGRYSDEQLLALARALLALQAELERMRALADALADAANDAFPWVGVGRSGPSWGTEDTRQRNRNSCEAAESGLIRAIDAYRKESES